MCTAEKKARSPHQPTGTWITPQKRMAVYLRDGFLCLHCLRDLHSADPRDVTLDHIIPKSSGGENDESNIFTACRSCNSRRRDIPLARFAGPETRKHIKRNTARKLGRYVKLAKALISGETGFEETLHKISAK